MKKKDVVILVSVVAAWAVFSLIFGSLYFIGGKNDQKHQAKEREYADFYREAATEYVKNDPEMIERYGDDFDFELDYTFWFVQDDDDGAIAHLFQRLSGKYIPQSLEDFNRATKRIEFPFAVGEDRYRVILNKDESGMLVPCEIVEEVEQ